MKHRKRISHRCGWFKKQDGIYRCGQCGQPMAIGHQPMVVRIGVAS